MKYVKQHKNKAKRVEDKDLESVLEESEKMFELLEDGNGIYPGGFALHHSQVSTKPLQFFVTYDKKCYINAEIVRHTEVPVDSLEGCLTFGEYPQVIVPRFHKVEVHCDKVFDFNDNTFEEDVTLNLSGQMAKVFQHELDHSQAVYVYDKEYKVPETKTTKNIRIKRK